VCWGAGEGGKSGDKMGCQDVLGWRLEGVWGGWTCWCDTPDLMLNTAALSMMQHPKRSIVPT
jgi:hypothetical protein